MWLLFKIKKNVFEIFSSQSKFIQAVVFKTLFNKIESCIVKKLDQIGMQMEVLEFFLLHKDFVKKAILFNRNKSQF